MSSSPATTSPPTGSASRSRSRPSTSSPTRSADTTPWRSQYATSSSRTARGRSASTAHKADLRQGTATSAKPSPACWTPRALRSSRNGKRRLGERRSLPATEQRSSCRELRGERPAFTPIWTNCHHSNVGAANPRDERRALAAVTERVVVWRSSQRMRRPGQRPARGVAITRPDRYADGRATGAVASGQAYPHLCVSIHFPIAIVARSTGLEKRALLFAESVEPLLAPRNGGRNADGCGLGSPAAEQQPA
jgi:hypothetical protein